MFPQIAAGYDRAITVFSPDGRLLQVEYAVTATKPTPLAIGIKCRDGVILLALKKEVPKLVEPTEKISKIDEHVGAIAAGLMGDGMVLIDRCRIDAQIYKLTYNELIPVKVLTKKIAEYKQLHTQYAGSRPFGAMLIIGGVIDKPELYGTHPSGAYFAYKVVALGEKSEKAKEYFNERYRDDITVKEALKLALEAVKYAEGKEVTPDQVDIAVIEVKDKKFRKLTKEEIEELIEKGGK